MLNYTISYSGCYIVRTSDAHGTYRITIHDLCQVETTRSLLEFYCSRILATSYETLDFLVLNSQSSSSPLFLFGPLKRSIAKMITHINHSFTLTWLNLRSD
uniref:Uncharacterized protein n=1 Tax=Rhizophora mucronata TaxID=61149 RepID=A0A2P2NTD3_RHIMU